MKYLFFDYDGTLTHNNTVSEKNIQALAKAKAHGHKILLHTGRSKANVPDEILDVVAWDGMICGKGYMEYEGKVLFEYRVSPELLARALDYCERKGVRILWEGVEKVYSNQPNPWLVDIYKNLPPRDELRITSVQIGGHMPAEDAELFSDVELYRFAGYSEFTPKGSPRPRDWYFLKRKWACPTRT